MNKKREVSLDLLKGILTVLMVMIHIIQFFPLNKLTDLFSVYVNLTTFSGFMFAFGYVCYIAYISKDIDKERFRKKMCTSLVKTLMAFYISGIGYTLLVEYDFSAKSIINIIILKKIPGYSEFLLSFAFIYIVIYFLKNIFRNLSTKQYIILVIVSLLSTYIPYSYIKIPVIGVLIGSTTFSCFPILQYLSYFLTGIYLSKNKMVFNKNIFILSIVGTGSFFVSWIINHGSPNRFPPSLFWITGGYFMIYMYFIICKKVQVNSFSLYISKVGQNTLSYLVISNILIFLLHRLVISYSIELGTIFKLIIYMVLFILCMGVSHIYNRILTRK